MPTFQTPEPILLRVKTESGSVELRAGDRSDTEVEVRPERNTNQDDIETAQSTSVEHIGGEIVIETPEGRRRNGSVRVIVGLPTGSSARVNTASADLKTTGSLDVVEVNTASGDVRVEQAGTLTTKTASGGVTCPSVEGDAAVNTASGDAVLGRVGGALRHNSASGDLRLSEAGGAAATNSASGDVELGRVGGSVQHNSASGDLRVASIARGRLSSNTVSGDTTVGVAAGTSAWLELSSMSGDVKSELDATDHPESGETVEIHARSMSGDIRIVRA